MREECCLKAKNKRKEKEWREDWEKSTELGEMLSSG